ncbi:MAG: hypothetical protein QNJ60_10950 [Xenococcaceae cyanobacterium MO_188.B19]|nr:hypothetical protein [Xenococcaceae cyanobacterium MO_188.B19]
MINIAHGSWLMVHCQLLTLSLMSPMSPQGNDDYPIPCCSNNSIYLIFVKKYQKQPKSA